MSVSIYVECVLKLCAWFVITKTHVLVLPMLWGPLCVSAFERLPTTLVLCFLLLYAIKVVFKGLEFGDVTFWYQSRSSLCFLVTQEIWESVGF